MPLEVDETIQKRYIDQLVLEYLIHEGYEEGAFAFAEELNLDFQKLSWQQSLTPSNNDQVSSTSLNQPTRHSILQKNLNQISKLPDHDFSDVILNYYSNIKYHQPRDHHNNDSNMNEMSTLPYTGNIKIASGYSTISQRQEIKRLILNGEITMAITKISQWFPTILDSNNLLHFKLLRLNLIEMIRSHKFSSHSESDERGFLSEILTFVRCNLINKISNSHKLLKELEFTMSLLCFRFDPSIEDLSDQKELPLELRNFFNINLRNQVFRLVNKEILRMYEVKSFNDYNQGYEEGELIKDVKVKLGNVDEIVPGKDNESIYESKTKSIVYTGPSYESFAFEDLESFNDDGFDSDLDDLDDEITDWEQLVDMNSSQQITKPSSELYTGEKLIRKDTTATNEDETESLVGLALESKLECLVKLFVLTEKKLQSIQSSAGHTFNIEESDLVL
ncbi:CTLH/CRA C-terminal to LisH motif domain family protein [Candida parapsilosis]|uniref:CTLH domain-containing protein n=2 Tax=Candida parapsilosis TaxID=5480 RepID=G8B9B2_CANPC|nr:uncharacterized protein CPAR2_302010 [Candida parapsilosis]KAF6044145.1 CTLH/CRA C-terminal to LisH motif domain family protein [Candida parapsilosis]KAF6047705.1 CTLH/CRA C-terminal to LisH motif domain family protein [Candida parapsilosis]KAF6050327.1 CTLH/CRA C-terminal to LisH motif domain family protein [Candida parapsilosis]KAF6061447.1 CTLH/CRA C-terminal to LisH motif domain family protein [Candida parapsilosis]KAI5905928.1 Glucose-induced degradation protein 8 [Candida parapsilosis